jgi:hypothetical protein
MRNTCVHCGENLDFLGVRVGNKPVSRRLPLGCG